MPLPVPFSSSKPRYAKDAPSNFSELDLRIPRGMHLLQLLHLLLLCHFLLPLPTILRRTKPIAHGPQHIPILGGCLGRAGTRGPGVRRSRRRLAAQPPAGASELILGLLVAVHDQLVEEGAFAAVRLVGLLGFLDLAVQVAGGFLVDVFGVVGFVEVCCVTSVVMIKVWLKDGAGWANGSGPSWTACA